MKGPVPEDHVTGLCRLPMPSPEEAAYLSKLSGEPQTLPAHRQVICDGRPCDEIFIVIEGWLAAYKQLRDGGRQILGLRIAGDYAGLECFAYRVAPYTLATLTTCRIAALSRADIDEAVERFPRLASLLVLAFSYNNALLQQFAISLGRRDALARVSHLLAELTLRLRAIGKTDCPIPLTQQDVADCTGLTTPYVNRILKRLREDGVVELERHSLRVRDIKALAEGAGFRPGYLEALRVAPIQGIAQTTGHAPQSADSRAGPDYRH
jgi:CRP-like cAMP-binding protein